MNQLQKDTINAKKVFKEKGTCSRTFAYILNKEFSNTQDQYEQALDPLAGGVMRKGQQCGMLWGSVLAIGTEAYKKTNKIQNAMYLALLSTNKLMDSFVNNTQSVNCREITGCNMDSFFGMAKYMIKVTLQGMNNSKCFKLAEDWAPDAIKSAKEGLNQNVVENPNNTMNCAALVVEKLGATDKEMVMVSGFAGGMGLSGNGCGALAAAIWMNSLEWVKNNPGKSAFNNPNAKSILKRFYKESNSEILCSKICDKKFTSIKNHSEFIENGGCKSIIEVLSQ